MSTEFANSTDKILVRDRLLPFLRECRKNKYKAVALTCDTEGKLQYHFIKTATIITPIIWTPSRGNYSSHIINKYTIELLNNYHYDVTVLSEDPLVITVKWDQLVANFKAAKIKDIKELFYDVAVEVLKNKASVEVNFEYIILRPWEVRCVTRPFAASNLDFNLLIDQRHTNGYEISYKLNDARQTIVVATVTLAGAQKIIANY